MRSRRTPFKPQEIVAPPRWSHLFDRAPSAVPIELQETTARRNPREAVPAYRTAGAYPRPRRGQPTTLPTPESYLGLRVRIALLRDPSYKPSLRVMINSAQDVYRLVKGLENEAVENMLAVCLDGKHRVIGVYEACRGQVSSVAAAPVDLLRAVIASGAAAFLAVHNHPSGWAEPSEGDRVLTQRIKQAAELLAIVFLDHVVVGEEGYVSFAERGEL